MNAKKNFEKISSENLMKIAGGIEITPPISEDDRIRRRIEETNRDESEIMKIQEIMKAHEHIKV